MHNRFQHEVKMQFIDLAEQQRRIRHKIDDRIGVVLDHGKYIMGPEVTELENRLSAFTGVSTAIGCASGTDALLMALMAYDVGPGDAIFTSPFTFIATGEVIRLLGATPVFVDINPDTFNIDPLHLEKAVYALEHNDKSVYPLPFSSGFRLRPKGIIPVDLFGLPADYDSIARIASSNELFTIEDAAQSFGSEYNGKKACSLADIGCTSFFPAKPLGCYGDGGMCFTDNKKLAEKLISIRSHGKGTHKYDNVCVGINGRLDTIQAAILLTKFSIFPEELQLRQKVAERYNRMLSNISGLTVPIVPDRHLSAWAQYSVIADSEDQRSKLQAKLKAADIPTAIYYPKPLHLQTAFADIGQKEGTFPISEDYARRIFSLPMHPYLTDTDQEKIVAAMD